MDKMHAATAAAAQAVKEAPHTPPTPSRLPHLKLTPQLMASPHHSDSRLILLCLLHERAFGHAIMYSPAPRSNVIVDPINPSTGIKIPPYADAKLNADRGCGGATNRDPGVEIPQVVYKPGETITVQWKLTIPHPADVLTSGIRIAIYYGPTDGFAQNILAGGVVGDPPYTPLSAGPQQELPVDSIPLQEHQVTLPMKTCDYCVLQWVWGAEADGGAYIGCADIAIKSDGNLPDYASLDSQLGRELPDGSGVGTASTGGGGIAAAVIIALLLVAAVGFWYFRKRKAAAAERDSVGIKTAGVAVPPAAPQGPPLPPGWTQAVDPASGATYYCNGATGQTQWTRPDHV